MAAIEEKAAALLERCEVLSLNKRGRLPADLRDEQGGQRGNKAGVFRYGHEFTQDGPFYEKP